MDPLTWISLGTTALPQILNVITHYKEMQNSGVLNETDKERMKQNLENLKLPDWETL